MKPVVDEPVQAILERGVTAYLGDVATLLQGAGDFLVQLEAELGIDGGCSRMGAFISPAGNGASCHYDVLDVISIQLVGTKQFNVSPVKEIRFPYGYQYNPEMPAFEDLYPQIRDGFPDYSGQEFTEIDMRPGSVLFMPRGTWHHTRADTDSLAISIALSPPTEMERLLKQLSSTLLQSARWRRPRYGVSADSAATYDELPAVVSKVVQREHDAAAPSRRFGRDSRYLRDPSVSLQEVDAGNGVFDITITGQTVAHIQVPPGTAKVFRWLMQQQGPFTVNSAMHAFPELKLDYFRQIFQVAGETGLARYLWFDPIG